MRPRPRPSFSQNKFDCIVVGAGIEGSSTAYSLAKHNKGLNVLLLEQFCLPHMRGSSHGQSRVTRYAYLEDWYMKMMPENYRCWQVLENEFGKQLFIKCGMLQIEHKNGNEFQTIRELMKINRFDFYEITASKACTKWPGIKYSKDFNMFVDKDAGVLRADRCLSAYQQIFVKLGGTLIDNEKVTRIIPGNHITVITSTNSTYTANSIIITPGAWSSKILRPLGINIPLKVLRINVCYWRLKSNKLCNIPTFVDTSNGYHIYGLPSLEYPGLMKICFHGSEVEIDPDARDIHQFDNEPKRDIDILKQYVHDHFPALESKPSIVETCMYTNTSSADPILDVHPNYSNIVIGCGFSGHGFKLAPVIGLILSQLAMKQEPAFDISHNKLARFLTNKSHL